MIFGAKPPHIRLAIDHGRQNIWELSNLIEPSAKYLPIFHGIFYKNIFDANSPARIHSIHFCNNIRLTVNSKKIIFQFTIYVVLIIFLTFSESFFCIFWLFLPNSGIKIIKNPTFSIVTLNIYLLIKKFTNYKRTKNLHLWTCIIISRALQISNLWNLPFSLFLIFPLPFSHVELNPNRAGPTHHRELVAFGRRVNCAQVWCSQSLHFWLRSNTENMWGDHLKNIHID